MSSHEPRRGRLSASLLALAATAALSAALAAPAAAVPGSGDAVIVAANHSKGRTLSGQGVKLLVGGALVGSKLTLPIAAVSPAGAQPSAASSASLTFKRGNKQLEFSDVRFDLAAGTLAGKFEGGEVPIFRVEGAPQVNPTAGTVALSGGKLRLVSGTAVTLKRELQLERGLLRTGVGAVWLAAKANPAQVTKQLASGSLQWGFLTSWREYIYKELGPGSVGSISTEGGATANGELAKPGASVTFPFASGSLVEGLYGASSQLTLKTQGGIKFAKPGHCIIEVKLSNLEAKIDGANSAIVGDLLYDIDKFTGKSCETQPPVSVPNTTIATLNTGGVAPAFSADGKTVTWANVPATLSATAAKPFEPQYKAGQALDPVTITVGIG